MKKLSITVAALLAAITMVQADIQPEKVLSENTLLVGTIRNVEKTGADTMSTPFGKLINDPSTAPLREYIKGELTTSTLDFKAALTEASKTLASCTDVFSGGVAFAITQPQLKVIRTDSGTGCDVVFVPLLLAETSNKVSIEKKSEMVQTKFKVLVEQIAAQTLKENASKVKTTFSEKEIDGVKINDINLSVEGEKCTIDFLYAFTDKLFVASISPTCGNPDEEFTDLQQIQKEMANIANDKTEGTALADSANFKNVKISEENDYLYINLDPITGLAKDFAGLLDADYKLPENPMEAMMALPRPMAIFNSLGLTACKSIGLTSYTIDGECYYNSVFYCPKAERRGLSALLDCYVKGDCAPTDCIPDTVTVFSRGHYDLAKLWETIDGTTSEVFGGIKFMVLAGVKNALEQNEDINLKEDILNNLSGDFISLNVTVDIENGIDDSICFLIGAKKPEAFISSIDSCVKTFIPDNAMTAFTIEGMKAYELANINASGEVYLAPIDGYVVITPDKKSLRSCLTAKKDNLLAKNAGFVKNVAKVGGTEQCTLSYTNFKPLLPVFKYIIAGIMNKDEKTQKIYELLPKAEDVEKFLGTQYHAINIDDNGLTSKSLTPWPEGLAK